MSGSGGLQVAPLHEHRARAEDRDRDEGDDDSAPAPDPVLERRRSDPPEHRREPEGLEPARERRAGPTRGSHPPRGPPRGRPRATGSRARRRRRAPANRRGGRSDRGSRRPRRHDPTRGRGRRSDRGSRSPRSEETQSDDLHGQRHSLREHSVAAPDRVGQHHLETPASSSPRIARDPEPTEKTSTSNGSMKLNSSASRKPAPEPNDVPLVMPSSALSASGYFCRSSSNCFDPPIEGKIAAISRT